MLVFGLVQDRGWEPDDDPEPPTRQLPHVPWRPFAWFALWCWLMVLGGEIGGLAGFGVLLGAVALGWWRLDRWMARQCWSGLREHRS